MGVVLTIVVIGKRIIFCASSQLWPAKVQGTPERTEREMGVERPSLQQYNGACWVLHLSILHAVEYKDDMRQPTPATTTKEEEEKRRRMRNALNTA